MCPVGWPPPIPDGVEVGHLPSWAPTIRRRWARCHLDETGKERPIVIGSYGIGPGRVMAAAVEQGHDEHGIVWPARSPRTTCTSSCFQASTSRGRQSQRRSDPTGRASCWTTATSAPAGCGRRPDRRADARDGREETLEDGAVDVRSRATGDSGASRWRARSVAVMARRRRFSTEAFGQNEIEPYGRVRHDVPRARGQVRPLCGLPQPPGARQSPRPVERRHPDARRLARSSRSTSASTG